MSLAIIDELLDTLQRERTAAISVDFDELMKISRLKEEQFSKLRLGNGDAAVLRQIKNEVSQNQVLILAVLDGVRSARSHINSVKKNKGVVNVYNEAGGIETFSDPSLRKSRRY